MTRWLLAITSLSSTGADSTGTEMPERFPRILSQDSNLDDRLSLHDFRSGRSACPQSQDIRSG